MTSAKQWYTEIPRTDVTYSQCPVTLGRFEYLILFRGKNKKTCYIAEGKLNKRFNLCISDFFFFKTSKVLSVRIRQWGMTFWSKFYSLQTRSYFSIIRTTGKGISTLEKMDSSQYFSIWTLLNIFLCSSY